MTYNIMVYDNISEYTVLQVIYKSPTFLETIINPNLTRKMCVKPFQQFRIATTSVTGMIRGVIP